MNDALYKTESFVRKTGMLSGGGHVIMGVSGGADSVFLFYVLKKLAPVYGLKLSAVHVHHGIRGEEADADARFVEELCRREAVPCRVVKADVPVLSREWRMSLEEAGRAVRRSAFLEEASRFPGSRIALAHHRNDLAETVIFQLARGTGLAGIGAFRPVSGQVIRPLLAVEAEEIRTYLAKKGLAWREDATNEEDGPSRNRIRHHVIPFLKGEVNREAVRHIAEAAFRVQEADDFLSEECRRRYPLHVEEAPDMGEGALRIRRSLLGEHPAMQKAVIKEALTGAAGGARDIGAVHIGILLSLLKEKETGKQADLIREVRALRIPEGLLLYRKEQRGQVPDGECPALAEIALPVRESSGGRCRIGGRIFEWELLPEVPDEWRGPDGVVTPPEKRFTKWLDYDMISDSPVLRARRRGDYLAISRGGGHKSLSDYLTDIKMEKTARDKLIVVCDGQEIMWVPGFRIGYKYRLTPGTKRVLMLRAADEESMEGPAL